MLDGDTRVPPATKPMRRSHAEDQLAKLRAP